MNQRATLFAMSENTKNQLKAVIVEHLGVDGSQVVDNARFVEDLEADSLDAVDLLLAVNDSFDIKIPNSAMEQVNTVKELESLIDKNLSKK